MDVANVGLGSPRRLVRVLAAVAAMVLVAVPSPADAQVPTPVGELPVPTTLAPVLGGDMPDNSVPPPPVSPPTTAPATVPTTAGGEQPRNDAVSTDEPAPQPASPSTRKPRAPTRRGAPVVPAAGAQAETPAVLENAAAERSSGPAIDRLRRVTVPAARQFGFPLVLGAFVLAFLAVQGRLDARDPKLAAAPVTIDDDLLSFR